LGGVCNLARSVLLQKLSNQNVRRLQTGWFPKPVQRINEINELNEYNIKEYHYSQKSTIFQNQQIFGVDIDFPNSFISPIRCTKGLSQNNQVILA
jgi:hypothetical protein